jgi:hypothetical protein
LRLEVEKLRLEVDRRGLELEQLRDANVPRAVAVRVLRAVVSAFTSKCQDAQVRWPERLARSSGADQDAIAAELREAFDEMLRELSNEPEPEWK